MGQRREVSKRLGSRTAMDRRGFMAAAGGLAMSFTVMKADRVRGTQANSRVRLGLIGCGMRGKWIAELFAKHGGCELVAAADYFPDRADEIGQKYGVAPDRRHPTLSGYKRLLEHTLAAILGRNACYRRQEVTWDEMMQANEKLHWDALGKLKA